jgi:hypothetical protein
VYFGQHVVVAATEKQTNKKLPTHFLLTRMGGNKKDVSGTVK